MGSSISNSTQLPLKYGCYIYYQESSIQNHVFLESSLDICDFVSIFCDSWPMKAHHLNYAIQ
jgi:hypothetical protein